MPWHLPEDFKHFKHTTVHQTMLMGRTTFESIGRPLPERETIVVTRNARWTAPGIHVAHDLQAAVDLAEDLPGDLMVVGGSHVYAAALPIAHMQVLSMIEATPNGDAYYPAWDRADWLLADTKQLDGFSVQTWNRGPQHEATWTVSLSPESANLWWSSDWDTRLKRAVNRRRRDSPNNAVNWTRVHAAATQVLVQAAEDYLTHGRVGPPQTAQQVRLSRHLSLEDLDALQGALFHWSEFVAPRR
jgi:dihydrofolate reductase